MFILLQLLMITLQKKLAMDFFPKTCPFVVLCPTFLPTSLSWKLFGVITNQAKSIRGIASHISSNIAVLETNWSHNFIKTCRSVVLRPTSLPPWLCWSSPKSWTSRILLLSSPKVLPPTYICSNQQ